MSRKTVSLTVSILGRSLLALGFAIVALQSCGSSSGSSSSDTALCNQLCNKSFSCDSADGGPATTLSMTQCTEICASQHCSNAAELASAANTCLAKSNCADFTACAATAPKCQAAGGTSGGGGAGAAMAGTNGGGAGTNGAGGTIGSGGGTSGAGSCSTCTKAQACCVASFQLLNADAGTCTFSAATCNSLGGSQGPYITSCTEEITAGALLGVAACQ